MNSFERQLPDYFDQMNRSLSDVARWCLETHKWHGVRPETMNMTDELLLTNWPEEGATNYSDCQSSFQGSFGYCCKSESPMAMDEPMD